MTNWLIFGAIAYYLFTHGGFPALGQRPQLDNGIEHQLPGGFIIKTPVPPGGRVYRLADGSQVVIQPNAPTAPGGWVQAAHNAELIWFNEQTGEIR